MNQLLQPSLVIHAYKIYSESHLPKAITIHFSVLGLQYYINHSAYLSGAQKHSPLMAAVTPAASMGLSLQLPSLYRHNRAWAR